ncbi:MAG TPA: hypothetical protein VFA63_02695, partial [Pseudonocardiaceae bacterium]|nr:hypothetical protein [Pseudonocardiaceae bacterium]
MLACYLRLICAGFRRYATYRQAVLAGTATNVVFGFMRCAVSLSVSTAGARAAGAARPARLERLCRRSPQSGCRLLFL